MKNLSSNIIGVSCLILMAGTTANAESLYSAMTSAYANNPTLNAARAQLRATNEGVPQALAGWRPTVEGTGSVGISANRTKTNNVTSSRTVNRTGSAGVTITQRLFNGFKTVNAVKAAEANVQVGRQTLRSAEQNILFAAVQAYMNVIRDNKIVVMRSHNVRFLREQVRASQARLNVGEGTKTDVALARSQLAQSLSELSAAKSSLSGSEASYVQIVGHQPKSLKAQSAPNKRLPRTLNKAIDIALTEHPNIKGANFNRQVANFNVKSAEGEFLPTVSLQGNYTRNFSTGSTVSNADTGSVTANVAIPIYSGGTRFSQVRQRKEIVNQRRIQIDEERAGVRSRLSTAWANFESAGSQIRAAEAAVSASRVSLQGSIEERRVGQKTTLDVLNAQSDLISAQISLARAQRDRVVGGYNILAEIGHLTGDHMKIAENSGVKPVEYHYEKVRDKWFGLRTASGQ